MHSSWYLGLMRAVHANRSAARTSRRRLRRPRLTALLPLIAELAGEALSAAPACRHTGWPANRTLRRLDARPRRWRRRPQRIEFDTQRDEVPFDLREGLGDAVQRYLVHWVFHQHEVPEQQ